MTSELTPPRLILASTSRYRRALLERLSVPFEAVAPAVDEESLKDPTWEPRRLAEHLAQAKAESLRQAYPTALLLGADQVAACEGHLLGKPGTVARAIEQLSLLQGRAHQLVTSICLLTPQGAFCHTDVTTLVMRPLRRDEIERYVEADRPLDSAGAYLLERLGIALFERIESRDFTAIVGLPLIELAAMLRRAGLNVP